MIYNINKTLLLEENAVKQHLQKYAMPYAVGGILGASALYNYINPDQAENIQQPDESGEPVDTRSPAHKLLDNASDKAIEVKNQVVDVKNDVVAKADEAINSLKAPDQASTPAPGELLKVQPNAAPVLNYDQYTGKLIVPEYDEHADTKKMLKVLAGVGTAGALALGVNNVAQKGVGNITRDVKNSLGNKYQDIKNYHFPDKEMLTRSKEDDIRNNNRELAKKLKEEKARAAEVSEKINSDIANNQTQKQSKWVEAGIPPPPENKKPRKPREPREPKPKPEVKSAITPITTSSQSKVRKKITGRSAGGR